MSSFLIYGANGYTGELIAREAVQRGMRPILAGRNTDEVTSLARELNLESRIFSLDDEGHVAESVGGMAAVLHCAGPFAHTAPAMMAGCLRAKVHYLDITGEVTVFEQAFSRDGDAKAAGVMVMPGVGFDVVPTDCLAAHLKRRLPSATRLALGINVLSRLSRGTATTMLENAHRGGLVRKDGKLTRVPAGWKTRSIDFGAGPVKAITIPWGDVSTAYHSTGIPNIEVYAATPLGMRVAARLSRYFTWALGSTFLQDRLRKRIHSGPRGPSAEERARGRSLVWGEAADDAGNKAVSRLKGPEGYTLTVLTAMAVVERVLAGQAPPGFQTPSRAYGPDFILAIEGVIRTDE